MNSWGNDSLERRINELLGSSVSPGSEPVFIHFPPLPAKPAFPWQRLVSSIAAVTAAGGLFSRWIIGLRLEAVNYSRLLATERIAEIVCAAAVLAGIAVSVLVLLSCSRRTLQKLF